MQFKLAVHRALYQFIALDSVQSKTFLLFSNDFLYAHESIDESFASMTPFLDKPFSSSASDQMPCYRSARTQERGTERRASVCVQIGKGGRDERVLDGSWNHL